MSKVELISLTPNAEKTMAYIARVSNPSNQKNEDYSKLLSYCIKNEHWSVFEQSSMVDLYQICFFDSLFDCSLIN